MINERYKINDALSVLFEKKNIIITWRKIWHALLASQSKAGFNIPQTAINEVNSNIENIDFNRINTLETECKHEIVANLKAFAELCPNASPYLHLGATSQLVVDNGDLIIYRDALSFIVYSLKHVIQKLVSQASKYSDVPCLAYTHFQPAQLTTVGKRFVSWCDSLYMDLENIQDVLSGLKLRGTKGAVGTQDSYLALYNDIAKVKIQENTFNSMLGFSSCYDIVTQTYNRKIDVNISNCLMNIGISAKKICNDIRLLSHTGEIREGFSKNQAGSSAMPYKKNPISAESITGLSRFLINCHQSIVQMASEQWLERSLDDSSTKRVTMSQIFLYTNTILFRLKKLIENLYIDNAAIDKKIEENKHKIVAERDLINMVKNGIDRQEAHEILREKYIAGNTEQNIEDVKSMIGLAKLQVSDYVNKIKNVII